MPRLTQTQLLFFSGGGMPILSISPSSWDFGNVELGVAVTKEFTIANTGTISLSIGARSYLTGYSESVALSSSTLAPNASATFTVQFDALFNANGYAGNISIASNSPSSPTLLAVTARPWAFYASGASNTAEIGTATRVQTDGTLASNGTKFAYTAQATPVWGDLSIRSQLITMIDNAAMVLCGVINESTRGGAILGWYPSTTIDSTPRLGLLTNSTLLQAQVGATTATGIIGNVANTDFPAITLARDTDSDANAEEYHIFVRVSGTWKRLWVLKGQNDASMYAGFSNFNAVGTLEDFKAEPRDTTLFNPPVSITGAVSAGQTWTAPNANFFLRKVLTTRPSAGSVIMKFRIQDANNYLMNSINSAGLQTLEKVVTGVSTSLGSGGAAVNGSIISLVADGTNVRASVGATNSYSVTVTEFATATGGELNSLGTGGAVSDIEIWLRDETGAVHTAFEAVLNG